MVINNNLSRIITWLVAFVTGMIVIISPLAFFFHSYQNTSAMLETEAEINANYLTHIVSANPDYWEFEEIRLAEYLQNRPKGGVWERRRIVNKKNEIVSESADNLQTPLIMRSAEIMDSGVIVGRIEIYRSLRPILKQTALIFLLILPVGLGTFFVLRTLPIRSLFLAETTLVKTNKNLETTNKLLHEKVLECQRYETELCKLNEQLESRVVERTMQLSTEIDERKQAEKALRDSEKKHKFLTDKMFDVVWMTDMNLRTVYVSPSIKTALGFTPEERMAQDITEQVTPATLTRVQEIMAKEYEREQQGQADPERTVTYEVEYYHKDGSIRVCENIASGVRDERGLPIGFHGVSRDITERKQAENALRESEKKYRELVNYLPLSLFEMDMEGNIRSGNPAILETFRYNQSDLKKGLNAFQMIIPDDRNRLRTNLQKLLLWERKAPTEYTGIRKDGSTFPFMIFSSVIIQVGKPMGIRGSIIDLTKQKQAEASLQKSEKKYRELVDFLPISIYEMDTQGNIISGNPEIFKTFGYVQDDLKQGLNSFRMLVSAQDIDRAIESMRRIISGEKTGGTEYTGIRKDGSTFPFLNIASPIISGNKPVGLRGAIIDLTKQKQAEASLQKSNLSLAEAQRIAHIGNWELDLKEDSLYCSDEIYRILGIQPPAVNIKYEVLLELVYSEDRELVTKTLAKTVDTGRENEIHYRIARRDGSVREVRLQTQSICNDTGKAIRLIGIIQDVTEQKKAERDLQNARDQLMQAEKLAAIGRLSAGVAHEILNPVNIISMELQLLQSLESLPPAILDELKICTSQISRIVTITENLKVFSRIPKKKMIMANINNVIDHLLTLHATQLKIEEIETDVHYQPGLPEIILDREKIEEVLLNLISNAMDAMEGQEKKILRITTEKESLPGDHDQLRIMIADTGTGIKSEDMSKIFDPFYTTKETGKGTGLGLSLAYGIIHDHDGIIWVKNNEWGGASFYIKLPIKTDINENYRRNER